MQINFNDIDDIEDDPDLQEYVEQVYNSGDHYKFSEWDCNFIESLIEHIEKSGRLNLTVHQLEQLERIKNQY